MIERLQTRLKKLQGLRLSNAHTKVGIAKLMFIKSSI